MQTKSVNLTLTDVGKRWLMGLLTVAVVAHQGCGVSGGGTGDVASSVVGSISGFGSVIINNVRYDDSAASIGDDDNTIRDAANLKLGMTVELQGKILSDGVSGTADSIRVIRGLRGSVQSLAAASNQFGLLGVTVTTDSRTVWDGVDSVSQLLVGDAVEVYGWASADGTEYKATRVEKQSTATAARLQGTVSDLNTVAGTFKVRGMLVRFDPTTPRPVNLSNGSSVVVVGASAGGSSSLAATDIRFDSSVSLSSGRQTEVEGVVQNFKSLSSLQIGPVVADLSAAGIAVSGGTLAQVANGVRLSVEGTVVNGVLRATEVEFEDAPSVIAERRFEINGLVTSFSSLSSFVVRDVRIDASSAKISGGLANALKNGVKVKVRGDLQGGRLKATELIFD